MAWDEKKPSDFSRFTPFDMPRFLEWWELRQVESMAAMLSGAYVEGLTQPWLQTVDVNPPRWVQSMLRWRMAAMWAYQQAIPLSSRLERGIGGLLDGFPSRHLNQFGITPQEIAEVPPQVRQAFIEGNKFSMQWVKSLGSDARVITGDLLAAQSLRNRNPMDAVPILENILRRQLVARENGVPVQSVSGADIGIWLGQASDKIVRAIAHRSKMIAATEQMRMLNLGILTSMEAQGDLFCFVMPHSGSCFQCQRLIDGRVFRISTLKSNLFENFGKKPEFWVAAMPQHPFCRHSPGPVPWRFKRAIASMDIPAGGVLLRWYGLSESSFNALELKPQPWISTDGERN
jgi:hypothetical protein